jgi:histidine ammonia-lyase
MSPETQQNRGLRVISIDGTRLTTAEIVAAARRADTVELTEAARTRVGASAALAERSAAERPLYGRTTGVGANRNVPVSDAGAHARALLRSHATSAGPLRSPVRVRAMLLVRLNQLAAGGSGASPAVLDGLAAMLAADALPYVREHGSVGTSDLPALATTALALMGEAPTTFPLATRVELGASDALPLMSSNAAAIGDAALASADLTELARANVVVAALTFAGVTGNREAFAEVVERVTPFAGSRQVCRWMRSLTDGAAAPARIQDPFGLRTLPQVHGVTLDALGRLDEVVSRLANAPSENPVFLVGPDGRDQIAHHGGFHASYLSGALDAVVVAVAESATLALARIAILIDPNATGLAPFLGDGKPGSSGVMVLEYVGASALGDVRAAATPSGLQTVVLSRGLEEVASFASLAARQAAAVAEPVRLLLACELVAAVRALRAKEASLDNKLLARALAACADLPDGVEDRDLTGDVELATRALPELAALLPD